MIRATDIPVKHPIDYRLYHDEFRNRIFSEITHGRGRKNAEPATEQEALVKKILYGALYPHAIKAVCDQYGLVVKGKHIEYTEFFQYFSKAIIATDLPGFELIIYLRSRQKKDIPQDGADKGGSLPVRAADPVPCGLLFVDRIPSALAWDQDLLRDTQYIQYQGYVKKIRVRPGMRARNFSRLKPFSLLVYLWVLNWEWSMG